MTDIQILKKARKLIEKGWCRHIAAKDKNGAPCSSRSKEAVKFCAFGALNHACFKNRISQRRQEALLDRLDDLAASRGSYSLSAYNDEVAKDKRYILRLYDRTIKKLERDAK